MLPIFNHYEPDIYKEIISPTVKITTDGEGTGVIIKKEKIFEDKETGTSYTDPKFIYFILTAKHIPEDGYLNIVSFLDKNNNMHNIELAEVYATSEDEDISILKLKSNIDIGEEVLIPEDDNRDIIKIGEEVFSYGCQNGFYPFLTTGVVSQFDKHGNILASPPITPGTSGSGLFIKHNNKYYLIGIASKIACIEEFIPIYHMGVYSPLDKIKQFLKDSGI